jgi:threonine dehydrogenase-like Zn-dependent dehydrogenase
MLAFDVIISLKICFENTLSGENFMLAVAVTRPNQIDIVDVPEPQPGPYEAKIRTEAACICNLTDRKLVEGHFPGVENYPLLLGHETVGIVEAVGEKVRSFKVGDRLVGGLLLNTTDAAYGSGWGGFSAYTIAGDHDAMVEDHCATPEGGWFEVYEIMRVVPADITVEDAVMLCTWREVYSAFQDFHLQADDSMIVYGDGPVGLSFVKFGRLLGLNEIYLVGKHPEKLQKALEMGATAVYPAADFDAQALVNQRGKFDAVIDAVGGADIINGALPVIKMGGTVGVYGVLGKPSFNLNISAAPYNFNLFMHQWPTRSLEKAAQAPLLEWIRAGKLSHKEFISVEFPIEQAAQAFEYAYEHRPVKTLFRY